MSVLAWLPDCCLKYWMINWITLKDRRRCSTTGAQFAQQRLFNKCYVKKGRGKGCSITVQPITIKKVIRFSGKNDYKGQ